MTARRTEIDSMGPVEVPADALYGAATQRAVDNFPLSGRRMPAGFIHALALIKAAYAHANGASGRLPDELAAAIEAAALEVAGGAHDAEFPVDPFQTGSGTSSNMNANEVIARLAGRRIGREVHPNDDVNRGQSSNDVVPSATQVAAAHALEQALLPALAGLQATLGRRAGELDGVLKTGRTHLMDALPVSFGQVLGGWASQIAACRDALVHELPTVRALALGGTAVGTGVNVEPETLARLFERLSELTGQPVTPAADRFLAMGTVDAAVALSGALRRLAVGLLKISNDLRWMNSGPLAGLGEIRLPALQPGSSIMPGKVNPVIPEAVAMVCAQVIGYDTAITVAGQSGSFELNVMQPLVACNLLDAIALLANAARLLDEKAVAGFTVDRERVAGQLARNPILATALNPLIGYDRAAEIAKRAYREQRPVLEVAREMTDLDPERLGTLLDPARLVRGDE